MTDDDIILSTATNEGLRMDFLDFILGKHKHKEKKMDWKEYPLTKPEKDVMAYVTNTRANVGCYVTSYDKQRDVFLVATMAGYHSMPVAITHYVELPPPPNLEVPVPVKSDAKE